MTEIQEYYYFSQEDKRLRYGDDRLISIGTKHTVEGKIALCKNGLHASKSILDALGYAPGNILWGVKLSGEVIEGDDKLVASEREYLWELDCTELLQEFSRWCALEVLHLWDAPDVVKEFLQTGDKSLAVPAADAAYAAYAARDAYAAYAARAAADAARAAYAARDAYAADAARAAAYAADAADAAAAYAVAAYAADAAAYAAYAAADAARAAYADAAADAREKQEDKLQAMIVGARNV